VKNQKNSFFTKFASSIARFSGNPLTFCLAFGTIIVWAVTGPVFKFSDTWQLVINTGTTIVTFLMVFLIQNTQNRDSEAIHLKLDELISVSKGANNELLNLEELTQDELDEIKKNYVELAEKADEENNRRKKTKSVTSASRPKSTRTTGRSKDQLNPL
jgi:low affinity Fe/Cu permease